MAMRDRCMIRPAADRPPAVDEALVRRAYEGAQRLAEQLEMLGMGEAAREVRRIRGDVAGRMGEAMKRFHVHWFRFVRTGVDFTHTLDEVAAMPLEVQAHFVFAGPVVHLYRCRCGATLKRRA